MKENAGRPLNQAAKEFSIKRTISEILLLGGFSIEAREHKHINPEARSE